MLKKLFKDERGEDLVEYALLTAFIALVALAAVKLLGDQLAIIFENIKKALA
jgi:Flp pilus assembly pilin Flp